MTFLLALRSNRTYLGNSFPVIDLGPVQFPSEARYHYNIDQVETLLVFLVWLLLASLGFLLTAPFFKSLPDRGLGLAPWVGLLFISFPQWWLGHTGFFQMSSVSCWLLYVLLAAAMGLAIWKKKVSLDHYKMDPSFLVYHFLIWLALYNAYVWFYKNNPSIMDIEKLPDMAMLVSSYRAEKLPPLNAFASDQVINYYYFGFYHVATFAHLTLLEAWQVFNPMKALIFATASSSLASATILVLDRWLKLDSYSSKRSLMVMGGTISFFFAYLMGNFHTMYHNVILKESTFWYPNATRYIDKTIHEFPAYSYIIGDLHAHLIAFPNAGLGLVLLFLYGEKLAQVGTANLKTILLKTWPYLLPLCFTYGLAYASNSWDTFTSLLLVGFLTWFLQRRTSLFSFDTLLNTGSLSVLYVFLGFVWFMPFWILFEPISSGVGHTPSNLSSPSIQLMVIWFIHGSFPLLYLCLEKSMDYPSRYMRTLCALGFGLIVFMEYFYFKDIYSAHLRANTLFKIGIQVWTWFSVATACYVTYIIGNQAQWTNRVRVSLSVFFIFLVVSGLIYTKRSVTQYIHSNIQKSGHIDGIDFMRKTYPGHYAITRWLMENEPRQVNVLTMVGDSFSMAGMINAFTGNPTVNTWFTHNWLWHGSLKEPMKPESLLTKRTGIVDTLEARTGDVKYFYHSRSVVLSQEMIKKYQIKYVVVSEDERTKYPSLNLDTIKRIGTMVLTRGGATLYKVSDYEPERR